MNYRLKRGIAITLIFIVLFSFSFGGNNLNAYANDPADAAFPALEDLFGGNNNNPYLTEYRNNYHLDMVELSGIKTLQNPEASVNILANILFKIQYYLGYLLVVVLYYSFELDIYGMFSGLINAVVGEMKIALFDELSLFAIVLLGLYYCVKMVSDQKTQVWVAIIQTVVLIALAMAFFTNTAGLLKGVDDFSKEMSRKVLTGTYRVTNQGDSPDSAVIAVANDAWMMFVHKPWQILEFGNLDKAVQHESRILRLPPGSEERKAIIKELSEEGLLFTPNWGIKRVGFMLLYLIPMTVMFLIIIILCLLILGYQFLTMFYALWGVFVFIIALIPFFGPKVVGNWASKILGSGLIKVIISFALAVIFAFNAALFNLSGVYGWFIILLLQLIVVGIIVWKRREFFEMITTIRMASQNGNINRQLRKDTNLESKINQYTSKIQFRKNKRPKNMEDSWDETETYGGGTVFSRNNSSKGDYGETRARNRDEYGNLIAQSVGSGTIDQLDNNALEIKTDMGTHMEHMNDSLRNLTKKAEELLERKYEEEKQEAEVKAEKTGKEPDYSYFVRRVQTRENLGAPRFDNREITAVSNAIDRAQRAGGSKEDVYHRSLKSDSKKEELKRPKNIESVENTLKLQVEGDNLNLDRNEAFKIIENQAVEDLTNEFNSGYGKQYDKAFFEELIKRYGKQNVREMLDRMKDVQTRERTTIKNPAGYLTAGLKKNERDKVAANSSITTNYVSNNLRDEARKSGNEEKTALRNKEEKQKMGG